MSQYNPDPTIAQHITVAAFTRIPGTNKGCITDETAIEMGLSIVRPPEEKLPHSRNARRRHNETEGEFLERLANAYLDDAHCCKRVYRDELNLPR